jgi:hypothetical protein
MIAAASLSSFIKTILWIMFIIYALRFLARLAAPVLIRRAEEHLREEARRRADGAASNRPNGHVKVDQQPQGGANPDPGGDYVDYVEIKD